MENKQTAVEWMFDKLLEEGSNRTLRWHLKYDIFKILEQAKEMEREQIIEAHDAAYIAMNLCFRGFDRSVEYYENNYGENRGSNQSITGKD
jgi:aminoglycoside phosphotransferase family enzyme